MIQKARTIIPRTNYYEGRPLGVEPTQYRFTAALSEKVGLHSESETAASGADLTGAPGGVHGGK
jgi:hypothetical protein